MSDTNWVRKKQLRLSFMFTKDFDRTTKMSDAELDKVKKDMHQKVGWYPRKVHQRIVHAFLPRERRPEDETAITGKIRK